MLSNGGKISEIDTAVFYWHDGEKLNGVIEVHVDDFFRSGSPRLRQLSLQSCVKPSKQAKKKVLILSTLD